MKYTATISGLGGALSVGAVSEKVFKYFQTHSLENYMNRDEEAPKDIADELDRDNPPDDILYMFGPFSSEGTYISVKDESDEEIFVGALVEDGEDGEYELPGTYEMRLHLSDLIEDHPFLFLGLDIQKGVFNDYRFETENFDPEKFLIDFDHITDGMDNEIYFVTGVRYDGELLTPIEEHSTRGKSAEYRLYDLENNELISTDDE
jgi:hypothetical protein